VRGCGMDAPGTGPIFVSCSGGDIEDQTLRMRTCDGPAHSRRHACDLRRARVCAGAPERNAGLAGRGVGPAVFICAGEHRGGALWWVKIVGVGAAPYCPPCVCVVVPPAGVECPPGKSQKTRTAIARLQTV